MFLQIHGAHWDTSIKNFSHNYKKKKFLHNYKKNFFTIIKKFLHNYTKNFLATIKKNYKNKKIKKKEVSQLKYSKGPFICNHYFCL